MDRRKLQVSGYPMQLFHNSYIDKIKKQEAKTKTMAKPLVVNLERDPFN